MSGKTNAKEMQHKMETFTTYFIHQFQIDLTVSYKLMEELLKKEVNPNKTFTINNKPFPCPKASLETTSKRFESLFSKFDVKNKAGSGEENVWELVKNMNNNKQKNIEMRKTLVTACVQLFTQFKDQFLNVEENDLLTLANDGANKILKRYILVKKDLDSTFIVNAILNDNACLRKSILELCWSKYFENLSGKLYQIDSQTPIMIQLKNGQMISVRDFYSNQTNDITNVDIDAAAVEEIMKTLKDLCIDDKEEDIKTSILTCKINLKKEISKITEHYHLEAYELMISLMEKIEAEIDKKEAEEDENKVDAQTPSGSKVTNIQGNSMKNWTSTFH